MTGVVRDATAGWGAVWRLLAFREGWREGFDVSAAGVVRSFAAVILCAPAFVFLNLAAARFIAAHPDLVGDTAPPGVLEAALQYLRLWIVFPLGAYLAARLMGLTAGFAPWLVVHNWTVFVLIHVQVVIWALYAAGIGGPELLASLMGVYALARLFVHWRVAAGALGLPAGRAALAASIPLLLDEVARLALTRAF